MLRFLRLVGQRGLDVLESLGRAGILLFQSLCYLPDRRELPLYVRQLYQIGVKSMGIIVLSAFSIGAVLSLQFYTQLARFGAEESIGLGLALVLLRELGPVVTGLLFAGPSPVNRARSSDAMAPAISSWMAKTSSRVRS